MKKQYIIFSLIVVLSFFAGFSLSYILNDKAEQSSPPAVTSLSSGQEDTFAAGWAAARQRLQETSYYFMDVSFPVMEIWGKILEIDGNKITISADPLDPLADKSLDERVVQVDGQTVLRQMTKKDTAEYEKELAAYQEDNQEALNGPVLPENYPSNLIEKGISLGDLAIGQKIMITTKDNIRDVKTFPAERIVVQYSED